MSKIDTNLTERLRRGRQLARDKYKLQEVHKLGNLRAGNSGIMNDSGEIAGSCPRVAHLRQLGINVEEPSDSKLIMFQMGTANETVVLEDLLQTSGPGEIILREEEIPIEWFTSNGTKVTGRPDMVVCRVDVGTDANGSPVTTNVPVFGVELKSVASVWTSREVLFENKPKLEHLIQSAHYSWKLGVPFKLMYKQYANQAIPQWANKFFPKQGEMNAEHIEYNDKGEVKNIQPFEIVYELRVNGDGIMEYRREDVHGDTWRSTIVSSADIEKFYEFTSNIGSSKELGDRPLTLDAEGNKKNWSKCGYCPMKPVCDKSEKQGYDKWLEESRKHLKVIK